MWLAYVCVRFQQTIIADSMHTDAHMLTPFNWLILWVWSQNCSCYFRQIIVIIQRQFLWIWHGFYQNSIRLFIASADGKIQVFERKTVAICQKSMGFTCNTVYIRTKRGHEKAKNWNNPELPVLLLILRCLWQFSWCNHNNGGNWGVFLFQSKLISFATLKQIL